MKTIYMIRGVLCRFYMRTELICKVVLKFLVYYCIFRMIAGWDGFLGTGILNARSIHMLLALVCVLLPSRFVAFFSCLIIIYNVYIASFWGAAMIAVLLLVLYVMIARLAPDEAFLLIAMPLAMKFDMILAIPLFGGLYLGVFSIIPMLGGVLLWGALRIIPAFTQFSVNAIDELPAAFSEMADYMVGQLLKNENLIFLMIVCFGVTVIVYLFSKMNFRYVRYTSLAVGAVIGLLCLLIGRSLSMVDMSGLAVLWAPVISFAVLCVIEFFYMALNYRMSQRLAFADDDYYYYVQVTPKILGTRDQKEIKTITNTTVLPRNAVEEEEELDFPAAAKKKASSKPAASKSTASKNAAEKSASSKPAEKTASSKKTSGAASSKTAAPKASAASSASASKNSISNVDEEFSTEKLEQLRSRTGWSDETIKSFLSGLDENI